MSEQYTVELLDGQTFGPADATLLRQWATEARVPPVATIRSSDGSVCRAIDCEPIKDIMVRIAAAPPATAAATDDPAVSVIIPYKNQPALIGYYTSIASLICVLGLVAGPAAVVLGVKGLQVV